MMKRIFFFVLAFALCLGLAGCGGSLPEGMDEEQVRQAAETTISQLVDEDYAALTASMDDPMKQAISEEEWPDIWEPVAQQMGAFVELEKHTIVGKDGMAVDVAKAKFENGTLTFTLSYDTSYRLAGLYMK